MPLSWVYSLAAVAVVSAVPLVGLIGLTVGQRHLEVATEHLVAFAVGALLGGALLHLLPESIDQIGALTSGAFVIAGFLAFFSLEKFLWAHSHRSRPAIPRLATLNLVGDALHNLVDGMVIAAAFQVDTRVGVAATVAVTLHEIPQEIGDFGVLVRSGLAVKKAVWFNLLSGLTAVAGALLALAVGRLTTSFSAMLLPVAAGGFIYIAASDLVPELHAAASPSAALRQIALIGLGVAVVNVSLLFR